MESQYELTQRLFKAKEEIEELKNELEILQMKIKVKEKKLNKIVERRESLTESQRRETMRKGKLKNHSIMMVF